MNEIPMNELMNMQIYTEEILETECGTPLRTTRNFRKLMNEVF